MIEVVLQRQGKSYHPFSEEDADRGLEYPENMPLKAQITGARKAGYYSQLCCYFGSCRYIASLNLNEDMNTKEKVDFLTRIKESFVEDTVYDDNTKRVHWIPKSLSYENCNQPSRTRFISGALERHAELAGVEPDKKRDKTASEVYVEFLNTL